MQTFARLLSVLTFLLSLGFIAQALPTTTPGAGLAVRQYNSPATSNGGYTKPSSGNGSGDAIGAPSNEGKNINIIDVMAKLQAEVDAKVTAMLKADIKVVADLEVHVDAIIAPIKATTALLVGAKVNIDATVLLQIAVMVKAIIILIVKACASVAAKVGVQACLAIFAELDVAIHALLIALNVVVAGFLQVLVKLFITLDAEVIACLKLIQLKLVIKVLAIVGIF